MRTLYPAMRLAAVMLAAATLLGPAAAIEADWLVVEQPLADTIRQTRESSAAGGTAVLPAAPAVTGTHKPLSGKPHRRGFLQALFAPREPDARRAAPQRPRATKAVRRTIAPQYLPATVYYETNEKPGTIIIDTSTRYLYLVQERGRARRYGVGVARTGFNWSGTARVGRKAEWPTWTPPAAMRKRQPDLPISMAGGPNNPLGARALYLFKGGRDTLYRIHGSNEPWTIGHAVSSGCIRMRNQDVEELYRQVGIGTKVIVM